MSSVSGVSSSTSSSDTTTRTTSNTLSQSDFLKVLVAQYANQIPTDSQDSNQFYTDLMNMSNYTAIQDTSTKVSGLSAQQLIGKTVTVSNTDGTTDSGEVTSTTFDGTDWYVTIDDSSYKLSKITTVTPTTTTTSSSSTSSSE